MEMFSLLHGHQLYFSATLRLSRRVFIALGSARVVFRSHFFSRFSFAVFPVPTTPGYEGRFVPQEPDNTAPNPPQPLRVEQPWDDPTALKPALKHSHHFFEVFNTANPVVVCFHVSGSSFGLDYTDRVHDRIIEWASVIRHCAAGVDSA